MKIITTTTAILVSICAFFGARLVDHLDSIDASLKNIDAANREFHATIRVEVDEAKRRVALLEELENRRHFQDNEKEERSN